MEDGRIREIVILGGGTSGWVAATAIADFLKGLPHKITLIESATIGTIGVGEATIPPFLNFIRGVGLDEREFIQETSATFKLGIDFVDWSTRGASYFHPFGKIGVNPGTNDFFQCWLRSRHAGKADELMAYCPAAAMASAGTFFPPSELPKNTPLSQSAYALHFDAGLVAKYLRKVCERQGVQRVEAEVASVTLKSDGFVEHLVLADGEKIHGDFFIDCSGFKGLIIEEAMEAGYENWQHYLPCDRAAAVQTSHFGDIPPYTIATARPSGWTWKIPLQHRTGNGYVFSSAHCSDDEAIATLLQSVEGDLLAEPRIIPFTTGMRKQMWKNNCLSLGLASGFLEPLESTSIHLVTRGLQLFLRHFPDKDCNSSLVGEFNRRMTLDYEEIRDFIVLHYCTTQREDSEFWRHCKNMAIPDTLSEKIRLFQSSGVLQEGIDPLFKPPSWQAVCIGMGIMPDRYLANIDRLDFDQTNQMMARLQEVLRAQSAELPSHADFILKNCSVTR